ncbi:molecular chaperone EcpD [Frateuria sp. Soil773]|uniref:fimbrial biogenesis chaperone n=1 Tax=Frateuria sp. Soil773 TaxID=1736407 RepID=UPI0006FEA5F0|nr:fimbria/pilus periplasmic chaperone [Frateuria sp. Soil773]KRE99481.1 molecular chaperone EcpD [Frateuria sp. Soil773]
MKLSFRLASGLALALLLAQSAFANVIINGTRVVYPGGEREVTIKLTNNGDAPALVQAWLDGGNPKVTPDKSDAPFVLTPPITRIEPRKGQTLRLMYTGQPLPQDKESVFWLNVLEVPPSPTGEGAKNYLQLAFRSRIKVFFRPGGLPGRANDAPGQLHWRVVPSADGHGLSLECSNPTPYHVSFSRMGVVAAGRSYVSAQGGMVAPGARAAFPLPGLAQPPAAGAEVDFTAINDYGGDVALKGKLEP